MSPDSPSSPQECERVEEVLLRHADELGVEIAGPRRLGVVVGHQLAKLANARPRRRDCRRVLGDAVDVAGDQERAPADGQGEEVVVVRIG